MAELSYRDAVAAAIAQEMERDPNVVLLGEDVAAAGGVFKAQQSGCSNASDRRACETRRSLSKRYSAPLSVRR